MNESVDHPSHYNTGEEVCECGRRIECIDVVRYKSFNIGNIIKYIWRHEYKKGIEDLRKAAWYLNDEIKRMEKINETNRPG